MNTEGERNKNKFLRVLSGVKLVNKRSEEFLLVNTMSGAGACSSMSRAEACSTISGAGGAA